MNSTKRYLTYILLVTNALTASAFTLSARTTRTLVSAPLHSAPPRQKKDNVAPRQKEDNSLQDALRSLLDAESAKALIEPLPPRNQTESDEEFLERHVAKDALTAFMSQDEALRLVSSEIGIKKITGEPIDDAAVALSILMERALDTVEDVSLHLRRMSRANMLGDKDPAKDSDDKDDRKTVVVLGSGWGAHALMKIVDTQKVRLVVVSPTNHFVFTPMLASASVGTVEYRSMTESVRDANPMMDQYIQGSATDVDVVNKVVTVQLKSLLSDLERGEPPSLTLDYDHLVVAVGNQVYDANVPGARDNCLRLKTSDDARRLRTAVSEAFEYASRPGLSDEERSRRVTFVIVGGGPTGVELAGELSDFIHDMTIGRKAPYPKLAKHANIVLIHGGNELLTQFDEDLRKEALRALGKRGVKVILNTRVTEVEHDHVLLSTKVLDEQGKPTGGRTESIQPKGLSVWCAGIAPVPFVDKLLSKLPEEARGQGGRVSVDRWLRPPMPSEDLLGSIVVLGDAASLPSRQSNEVLPQTAQVAGQQGAYIARMLTRGYNLTAPVPSLPCSEEQEKPCADPSLALWLMFRNLERAPGFSFLNLGLLAYLGGGKALSQVQIGDVPVFSYTGSVAFVLWRSVYLVKQVATKNRVLVTFDWVKIALFGRDTTRL